MKYDELTGAGQTVVMSIHRHPIVLLPSIVAVLFMTIIPLMLGFVVLTYLFPNLGAAHLSWVVVGFAAYYLFLLVLATVLWMDYYYDMYVVTDSHILDINQRSLLFRRVARTSLLRVQDVTVRVLGLWASILDYGTVNVQTAGHEEDITLLDIPKPAEVARSIMQLHDAILARQGRKSEVAHGEGVHPPIS
jgi:uncharacterized membrane protein YdbT with pleckstrin-like domain